MKKILRSSVRGVALLIVLVVISLLMIVAAPFVASMLMHENTSKTVLDRARAFFATEGARNYAVAQLYRTNDPVERRIGVAPFNTPYSDGPLEFRVDLRDQRLAGRVAVADPADIVWGVRVEDEQGKVNLSTAPPAVIDRLRSVIDARIGNVRSFVTLYSGRETRWIVPQRIRGVSAAGALAVDNGTPFGVGAKIRVSAAGRPSVEATVTGRIGGIVLSPTVSEDYVDGYLELEARHPVNVNTAPRETLALLFEGLTTSGNQDDPVTTKEAYDLATKIAEYTAAGNSFTTYDEFDGFIDGITGGRSKRARDAWLYGVIMLNAREPTNTALDGSGTMPLTFRSYDAVTIETTASANSPSGSELTSRVARDVMLIAPPGRMTAAVESQYDFDLATSSGRGYPFGNKILTMPIFPADVRTTDPTTLPLPDRALKPNDAWFSIRPARDERGTSQIFARRESFDTLPEGYILEGDVYQCPWTDVFAPIANGVEVNAGGMEMWVRFDRSPADGTLLFDIREDEYSNRVSVQYTGGELVFSVADATLDRSLAQIRRPFDPRAEIWYHIGAYWKGTSFGHLALLVDGFSHPAAVFRHTTSGGGTMVTTLSADLPATDQDGNVVTSLQVANSSALPSSGVIEIGNEVIAYANRSFQNVIRGARGTGIANHPAGAKVTVYGYANALSPSSFSVGGVNISVPTLKRGNGRLSVNFGIDTSATVYKKNADGTPGTVPSTESDIPVTASAIDDFPAQGHIRINNEVIQYQSIERGRPRGNPPVTVHKFRGCTRGALGTTAADIADGASVSLYGFAVSSTSDYLSPLLVQIGDEWIGPLQSSGGGYFTGVIENGMPRALMRGYLSTRTAHTSGEEVVPVFRVQRAVSGGGDRVTLIDADNRKESHVIRRVSGNLVAFADFVNNEYPVDNLHTRLLKFPSGELLSLGWLTRANPQVAIGAGMSATIDEVKFYASPKGNFRTMEALDVATGNIQLMMNTASGLSTTGGAIKIGDEIVGYPRGIEIEINRRQYMQFQNIRRGYLDSPTHVHDAGDRAFNMSFLPITSLANAIDARASSFILRGAPAAGQEGYLYLGDGMSGEVAGYTNGGATMSMIRTKDGTGLLRGMFGTDARDHAADTMVYAIPFRYWDTYKPREFDNRMVYFQTSVGVTDATWRSVLWEQENPAGDGNLTVKILVRLDDGAEWIDAPSARGPLYEFTTPAVRNEINRRGDAIDVRCYFTWQPGSFFPADSWKLAPKVRGIWIDYERETRSVFHEER